MKTMLQTAVLFGLLLGGHFATAQEPTAHPVCLDQVADCVYLVRVSNPAQATCRLQVVRTADGAVLFEKTGQTMTFGEKLDVSSLADGRYAVVVKMGPETHRFNLNLRTTQTRSASLISLANPVR
ncbi:hypothetical protein [Hymenobacter pini]|uniref:hypothetical protein n=1 Tax=Hymenobacter pini TaxID=2880879 RepID=UPI001CF47CB4|nr:hypothetical protein [Hymenobacter pini]MCA8832476.1 hypothetical protein [Hymenobacter pini]